MLAIIAKLPLLVLLMGLGSLAMLFPALHAAAMQDFFVARVFVYSALLFGFVTSFLAIAMAGRPRSTHPRRHLLALLGLFVLLPVMFAVPLHQAIGNTSFLNAYVEMVSSLTTTGATMFDDPGRLPDSVHLWRAIVGWMGGFFILVGAIAILAPMSLGGFEVRAGGPITAQQSREMIQITHVADISQRIRTYSAQLFPIYGGLTLVLWIALIVAGDLPFLAFCHALSTLATSGISPVAGPVAGGAGYGGEVLIAIFLLLAISRLSFSREGNENGPRKLLDDPEVRMAAAIVLIVPLFLFARHWIGAFEVEERMDILAGLGALWGGVFTVLSFLTTTGFESAAWASSRNWSGLQTPGLVLMGLALVGGGVATTAGGAKLLRVYALYKHGMRELDKLVHPSSVGGSGGLARHIRGRGAYMAWLFFMLMTMSVALIMLALSLTGQGFETSLVLTVAALTTTGPLANVAAVEPISFGMLPAAAKMIVAAAMVLGRLETLAIIALLNPDIWRR